VTWALVTLSDGTRDYTLSGSMSGMGCTGASVVGATIQLTVSTASLGVYFPADNVYFLLYSPKCITFWDI